MNKKESNWGPSSPSLWLTRPLGYWELQLVNDWPPATPGPRRCTCNNLTHIVLDQETDIKLDLWEKAVRWTVYKEPNLRADVNLNLKTPTWVPATDFSQVFSFRDLRDSVAGSEGVAGVWPLVEDEVNRAWSYGSGQPLYRHTLLRVDDGYMVMNCYHHAAADGTSGMLIMMDILEQYNNLLEGKVGELVSHQPRCGSEELVEGVPDPGGVVEKMRWEKINRALNYSPVLPVYSVELESNRQMELPINSTLWREGCQSNYRGVREFCRSEGITVGALVLASIYMAKGAIYGLTNSDWGGLTDLLVDIPVSLRQQVEPAIGHQYAGFLISELTTKVDLSPEICLLDLAKTIGAQLKEMLDEKQQLLFNRVKEQFETEEKTAELAASVAPESIADVLFSNKRNYPGPLVQPWGGRVRAIHSSGSYWTPGFCNFLVLVQSTDIFTYNLVHCPGTKNTDTAVKLMDTIVLLVEGAVNQSGETLAQLTNRIRSMYSED